MADDDGVTSLEQRSRRLPHWEAAGATYFTRFGLRRPPAADLTRPDLAQAVTEALLLHDGERYILYDYTIMPDHVHAILKPLVRDGRAEHLHRIMRSVKGALGRRLNGLPGRQGPLWQDETYDHMLRDQDDYLEKAAYIWDNPRRSGLVADPADWPWWGRGSGGVERGRAG